MTEGGDHSSPVNNYWYQQDTETKEFFKALKPIYCNYVTGHCYMNMLNINRHKEIVHYYNKNLEISD